MEIDINKNKASFIALVKAYVKRDGIDTLMQSLEKSDFYTAPASTRFHGSVDGGLCAHSIAVGKQLMALADLYAPGVYSKESLVIVALFHDLCKIGVYKRDTRNVKNEASGNKSLISNLKKTSPTVAMAKKAYSLLWNI